MFEKKNCINYFRIRRLYVLPQEVVALTHVSLAFGVCQLEVILSVMTAG